MENYDTAIVIQNFGKLRNIILNTQEKMMQYMKNSEATDHINAKFRKIFKYAGKENTSINYLQIIVYVTLQFIMGQAVESVNAKLFEES